MFTAEDVLALLADATPNTIVHLDYVAGGNKITKRAKREFAEAKDWGKAPTQYVGNFVALKRNKYKELVLELFVHNRGTAGSMRSFNPNVGEIRAIHVVNPS